MIRENPDKAIARLQRKGLSVVGVVRDLSEPEEPYILRVEQTQQELNFGGYDA